MLILNKFLIQGLTHTYNEARARMKELQTTLKSLKEKANAIKNDIQVKEKYFNQCG